MIKKIFSVVFKKVVTIEEYIFWYYVRCEIFIFFHCTKTVGENIYVTIRLNYTRKFNLYNKINMSKIYMLVFFSSKITNKIVQKKLYIKYNENINDADIEGCTT